MISRLLCTCFVRLLGLESNSWWEIRSLFLWRVILSDRMDGKMGHVKFNQQEPFYFRKRTFSVCDSDLARHFKIPNRSGITLFSESGTPMCVRMPKCYSVSCTNLLVQEHAFMIAPEDNYYIVVSAARTTADQFQTTPPRRPSFPLSSFSSPPKYDRTVHFSYPISPEFSAAASSCPSSYPISPDTLATSSVVVPLFSNLLVLQQHQCLEER